VRTIFFFFFFLEYIYYSLHEHKVEPRGSQTQRQQGAQNVLERAGEEQNRKGRVRPRPQAKRYEARERRDNKQTN
jgi:hypothetical protein